MTIYRRGPPAPPGVVSEAGMEILRKLETQPRNSAAKQGETTVKAGTKNVSSTEKIRKRKGQPICLLPESEWGTMLSFVCESLKVHPRSVMSGGRGPKHIAEARHLLMYLLKNVCRLSHPMIGALLNRDQSTVTYGVAMTKHRMSQDQPYAEKVAEMRQVIKILLQESGGR